MVFSCLSGLADGQPQAINVHLARRVPVLTGCVSVEGENEMRRLICLIKQLLRSAMQGFTSASDHHAAAAAAASKTMVDETRRLVHTFGIGTTFRF